MPIIDFSSYQIAVKLRYGVVSNDVVEPTRLAHTIPDWPYGYLTLRCLADDDCSARWPTTMNSWAAQGPHPPEIASQAPAAGEGATRSDDVHTNPLEGSVLPIIVTHRPRLNRIAGVCAKT
jgi:hypothetical protein